jgi:hypothetical protein
MNIENGAASGRRGLTRAQHAVLTVAILAGFGLIGAGLWAFELWIGSK